MRIGLADFPHWHQDVSTRTLYVNLAGFWQGLYCRFIDMSRFARKRGRDVVQNRCIHDYAPLNAVSERDGKNPEFTAGASAVSYLTVFRGFPDRDL
jgi:hypothetical protein